MNSLIKKANKSWNNINPDEWLLDLRGGYEALCFIRYKFFIRLLNDQDPLHLNAVGYFKYFMENEIALKVSTISIAEYCVLGELSDLPLKNIQNCSF